MEALTMLGISVGIPLVAGLNLYATVLTVGILVRFDLAMLPPQYEVFGSGWVIGIAGALYVIEFFADKIPWLDSAWDAVHTFIRVPAGAALALMAVGDVNEVVQVCAFLLGGGVSLAAHSTKAGLRLAVNTLPEPVSNSVLSVTEDILAFTGAWLALAHPVIMLVIALFCLIGMIVFVRKLIQGLTYLFRTAARRGRKPAPLPEKG